jgi:hypothetical protein
LARLTVTRHQGLHIGIAAFDGGAIRLTSDEQAAGWSLHGDIPVSPLLSSESLISIPLGTHDEWYVVADPESLARPVERFVVYGGLTLASRDELIKSFDPTWDVHGLDYLPELQDRFWQQIDRIKPITYFASGDRTIIVSLWREFVDEAVTEAANLFH